MKNMQPITENTVLYVKARFWKCALQVNPSGYSSTYRGIDHGMSEDDYNNELVRICKSEDIKVVGLADHGNVDCLDKIRNVFSEAGITVFPGFEIASSEKAHFVCLFPENTNKDVLNRYLGNLELTDIANGVRPSRLSGEELLRKVKTLDGFCYAAHVTDENGLLFRKLNHVWKSEALSAVQITGSIEDLNNGKQQGFRQILLNKDPEYKRERPIGIINANDVAKPEDLRNKKSTCLIKMTKPCFESFKQAFLDPASRVRLNDEIPEKYYSRIESVKFTGGYLDGLTIEFSEHLNAVIGGRGTGKSTLLECIRYALDLRPVGKNAVKQHEEIIKENLGKVKGRIELTIRSSRMNGNRFVISRRYGENSVVKDATGEPSNFLPSDLMPRIEIYGQNEIFEIAKDTQGQFKLLNRFLDIVNRELDKQLDEIASKLKINRNAILEAMNKLAEIEEEVKKLPKLQEQVNQFKELGLEEKLKIIPKLETEKKLSERIRKEIEDLSNAIAAIRENLPDTIFLSDKTLEGLPHAEVLQTIRGKINELKTNLSIQIQKMEEVFNFTNNDIIALIGEFYKKIAIEEKELENKFRELPASEGRSGIEIGLKFQSLLREIESIRPKTNLLTNRQTIVEELKKNRMRLLDELSEVRAKRSALLQQALKRLNRKLEGKLRLSVATESNRSNLIEFLNGCNLEGIGQRRLAWVESASDFSPVKLAQLIQKGSEELKSTNWGITQSVADGLVRMSSVKVMELEEVKLEDTITIELNVAHEGQVIYRSIDKLSTGQQCTALLHMLLLDNLDPLIMDQPEDNLDNAFIADRIVTELRSAKIARQFLFATHNANIPVFGDAEWIGVFVADDGHSTIPNGLHGAIDLPEIQEKAAEILEGGRTAFIQRKDKYGF